jgi:SSS family solute:Na+ symporter
MVFWDYVVLVAYFALMIGIGVYSARRVKKQEDFFMGGRSFGKLLQTFAAFGAGTGSSDPVNTARTTFTSGMSGMWSVMYWLFVTPFYWIAGVWYRRMRHLTLGDWFVERYESRALGAGYAIFGILFFMVYGSMMFSAIGKVAAPLVGFDAVVWFGHVIRIEYVLVPIIGVVVLVYGIAGGLRAAYYTDLVQGSCIILLSVLLIPFGLSKLVEQFGDPATDSIFAGFRIMHIQLPAESFHIVGSTSSSEFPLHRIVAIVIINLIGIVVQPHFIATGGGSAKTENSARVGLVTGNFLKRFCTIGWVLTALIAVALYADKPELVSDPDRAWGVASRELLPVGLTGLMLACLLAALMSSADAYMIVGSGLIIRNLYAPYVNPNASEKQYVFLARLTGVIVVGGAVIISLFMMDVFKQLQLTWVFNILFAAPFWVGMYWRGATKAAAWITVAYCALAFFLVPFLAPRVMPALRMNPALTQMNDVVVTSTERPAAPSDVKRRRAAIDLWDNRKKVIDDMSDSVIKEQALENLGQRPDELELEALFVETTRTGGQAIFWPDGGVKPVDEYGEPIDGVELLQVGEARQIDEHTTQVVTPFVIMILASFFTRRNSKRGLDRYYAKMKTPVDPDPEIDHKNLELAYAAPEKLETKKLFPGTSLEIQRPTFADVAGFVVCLAICFGIVYLAVLVASLGSGP